MEIPSVQLRVGNRASAGHYVTLSVAGVDDSSAFEKLVVGSVENNPDDPLIMCVTAKIRVWLSGATS